jgi:hypothetical protein
MSTRDVRTRASMPEDGIMIVPATLKRPGT